DHPEQFRLPPAVFPDGTLTFEFNANSNGTVLATIFAYDSAWVPISPTYTFTITATPVYDPPILTLTYPTNGAVFNEGDPVPLAASAVYIESILTNMEFLAAETLVAQDATRPYAGIWTNPTPGVYALTARGRDNFGNTTN